MMITMVWINVFARLVQLLLSGPYCVAYVTCCANLDTPSSPSGRYFRSYSISQSNYPFTPYVTSNTFQVNHSNTLDEPFAKSEEKLQVAPIGLSKSEGPCQQSV